MGYGESDFFWQGEALNVSHDEEQPCWLVMVSTPFMVMVHRVFDQKPGSAALWDVVLEALQMPQIGDFRRPTTLRVKANQGWEILTPQLQPKGITLETCAELELVDGWIETVDSAFVEWDKRRTKWKVVRRDEQGNLIAVETGLSRKDADLSVVIRNGEDEKHTHWVEREAAGDG